MVDLHVIPLSVANELKAIVSIKEREQKAATMLKEAQRRLDEIKDDKEMLVAKLEVCVVQCCVMWCIRLLTSCVRAFDLL